VTLTRHIRFRRDSGRIAAQLVSGPCAGLAAAGNVGHGTLAAGAGRLRGGRAGWRDPGRVRARRGQRGRGWARLATARSAAHLTVAPGSPGNPLVVPCGLEAWPGYPTARRRPARGRRTWPPGRCTSPVASPLATQTPARYGYAPFGRHGRAYKVALVVRPGATITVTIGARARGYAVIDNPAGEQRGLGGVTSATYHACRKPGSFFAQGFVFTRPPFRGCVPLNVTAGGQALARQVTLSLFAGHCRGRGPSRLTTPPEDWPVRKPSGRSP
jgi:hypothetical protein